MRLNALLGMLLGLTCSASSSQADPREMYTLDPARSEFVVRLFKAGVGAALAHDHVVRATEYQGHIQADLANPASASITVEIQAASLKADEPAIRQKYGLSSSMSDEDRQATQTAMEAEDQLNIAQYPTLRFRSTQIVPQTAHQYQVTGELTIRGVTRSVMFPVQVALQGNALHASGTFRFKQSSFGYEPYSAFWGAVKNKDEVELHFDLTATRQ